MSKVETKTHGFGDVQGLMGSVVPDTNKAIILSESDLSYTVKYKKIYK